MCSPEAAPHIATVLAVDDNAMHCYALARSLEARGFQVLQARTGDGSLRMAAEQSSHYSARPEPADMDGFEIMRRLKARSPVQAERLSSVG